MNIKHKLGTLQRKSPIEQALALASQGIEIFLDDTHDTEAYGPLRGVLRNAYEVIPKLIEIERELLLERGRRGLEATLRATMINQTVSGKHYRPTRYKRKYAKNTYTRRGNYKGKMHPDALDLLLETRTPEYRADQALKARIRRAKVRRRRQIKLEQLLLKK